MTLWSVESYWETRVKKSDGWELSSTGKQFKKQGRVVNASRIGVDWFLDRDSAYSKAVELATGKVKACKRELEEAQSGLENLEKEQDG